jgi:peptidoglycan/LPS O-acetylase OafA/YrhL
MPGPVAPIVVRPQRAGQPAAEQPARQRFRPDIEGLRGIAVLLVIIFHAWPDLLGGGFIGVDVFFVISGFLITGLLYRELGATGRIGFRDFYARRVRRLFPAASVALLATFLLSAWLLSPLALPRVAGDGVAAALSVANIRFALASGDYFTAVATPSPFLHYWSLSVEEQFYLVWPATLLLVARFGGLRLLGPAVLAVAVLSLVLAVAATEVAAGWAFYSLPTRAWQLAVGGLLAIVALDRFRRTGVSGILALAGWVGLGGVLLAGFAYDDLLAYPGWWALLPTLGAVLIIAGGNRRLGPGLLLGLAPLRFTGRISYALYLWHWPLLVLPAAAWGGELPVAARLALVALAFVVASVSTLVMEEPIRRGTFHLTGRSLRAAAPPLAAMGLAVVVGVGATTWVHDRTLAQVRGDEVASTKPPKDIAGDVLIEGLSEEKAAPRPEATPKPSPRPEAMASREPATEAKLDPTAKPTKKPKKITRSKAIATPRPKKSPKPAPDWSLPKDVRPSLIAAPDDHEFLKKNGCLHAESATWPKSCVFGKTSSPHAIALVGDSHASHWFPALRRVADDRGWRLETYVKVSCPFTDILVRNLEKKKKYKECLKFNEAVVQKLKASKPDLVVTAVSRWQHPVDDGYDSPYAQGDGIARMLEQVPGKPVVLADVPYPGHDVPECLAKNLKDIRPCAAPAGNRNAGGSPTRERQAANASGGVMLNFYDLICKKNDRCLPVRNDVIVWRDHHHLTATFARTLAPALDRALQKVVPKRMRR